MNERAKFLVETLGLKQHPEGGYYSETFRSTLAVQTPTGERNLMTCIYFLLTSENPSQFHSIKGDEIWFHHEGNDLSVHCLHNKEYKVLKLGRTSPDSLPQQRVNGEMIFGSTVDEPNGYALVSCVVSPGFDFQDFRLYTKKELLATYEQFSEIIMKLGH